MASWIMHLAIAKGISKHLKVDLDRFYIGNLLPDAPKLGKTYKMISHFRVDNIPYEESTAAYYQYYDYMKFFEKYKDKMDDDAVLGYFSHLLTDELWIQQIYNKYMRDENREKRDDQRENYYVDYDLLNQLVREEYGLEHDETVYINTDFDVDALGIEEIREPDLQRMVHSLREYLSVEYPDTRLNLFKEEDILRFVEEAIENIINVIKDEGIRS